MEAFSDGVIAVIITIMVLEIKVPHGADWSALRPLIPTLLIYLLSFVFVGIYWKNHHHLLQAARRVNGQILWANLHLLFWLSLVPFVTAWMGESHLAVAPVAVYGVVLLCSGAAYFILSRALMSLHSKDSALATAVGTDFKGKISVAIYVVAISLCFVSPWLACALYALVDVIWLIPDRRIEKELAERANQRDTAAD